MVADGHAPAALKHIGANPTSITFSARLHSETHRQQENMRLGSLSNATQSDATTASAEEERVTEDSCHPEDLYAR